MSSTSRNGLSSRASTWCRLETCWMPFGIGLKEASSTAPSNGRRRSSEVEQESAGGARVRHSRPTRERPPQVDRRPHPIRPPFLAERLELSEIRFRIESVLGADRPEQPRLSRRQLVDGAQRAQPHQLRAELADPGEALQPCQRLIARKSSQCLGVELARESRPAETVEVFDLAAEQALK